MGARRSHRFFDLREFKSLSASSGCCLNECMVEIPVPFAAAPWPFFLVPSWVVDGGKRGGEREDPRIWLA
jgi:hypothetical protein